MGGPSKRVRDELWVKACRKNNEGVVTQLWTSRNEQGYLYRQHGVGERIWLDFEGLGLVVMLRRRRKAKVETDEPP